MTVCDRGRGVSKILKNSVTYFMDGPETGLKSLWWSMVWKAALKSSDM